MREDPAWPPADVLSASGHRPWPLPNGRWNFLQNWRNAVFLHYQVDASAVQDLLPRELTVDTHDGGAWISIVLFSMVGTRPSWLPAWSVVSDFHEMNVRTYVQRGDRNGVFFLSIDAGKWISVQMARLLSVLPYRTARVRRGPSPLPWFNVDAKDGSVRVRMTYTTTQRTTAPDGLDRWLVERYALYEQNGGARWCYNVHHAPWPLQELHIADLMIAPEVSPLIVPGRMPDRAHFSPGVTVLSWPPQKL